MLAYVGRDGLTRETFKICFKIFVVEREDLAAVFGVAGKCQGRAL